EMEQIAGQANNDRPAEWSVPAVRLSGCPARLPNAPCGRTVIAGLTRNLFHLPNAPRLSPPSAGHWRLPVTAASNFILANHTI
ncbi:MAG: hypothetical protein LBD35_03265, partial [Prevotellaceae bacterium]|nr:hypothetical protein [Prevotellaceae bacterium]